MWFVLFCVSVCSCLSYFVCAIITARELCVCVCSFCFVLSSTCSDVLSSSSFRASGELFVFFFSKFFDKMRVFFSLFHGMKRQAFCFGVVC